MKAMIVIMFSLFLATCACAQDRLAVTKDLSMKWGSGESMTGTVKAVRFSSLQTAGATLIVTDPRGDDVELSVRANVAIFSNEIGTCIRLCDLCQGMLVKVKYEKTPEGLLAATAIKVLSQSR